MQNPSEQDLITALVALRSLNPVLGIPKLHALLLSEHSDWAVSEKRTRKVLQNQGLVLNSATKQNEKRQPIGERLFPESKVVEGLDVGKWTKKVEVRYFGRSKGKGLVAKEAIAAGEAVWKEDPFILAPEWSIYDMQISSVACAHCSTPFSSLATAIPCSAHSRSPACNARFCNRLCLSRSNRTHPLLCPGQNPACVPLLSFARKNEWMALHALVQCTAKILLDEQQEQTAFDSDWEFVHSLAQLGMEDRARSGWLGNSEPDRATWKKAYEVYCQAFQNPTSEPDKNKLARILKRPIRKEVLDYLFNYDAFLRGLGRMSLNLEAHGGVYVLHSHMNHACTPNISVRHLDQRTALSRINAIAKTDIQPGEELFITYVNPELSLEQRRQHLLEWGFGTCKCSRCVSEEQDATRTPAAKDPAADDLERELKAGLGVL